MAKTFYLPAAGASAAVQLRQIWPVDGGSDGLLPSEVLAVEFIHYGIIAGVQMTSLVHQHLEVREILINGEFYPTFHAPREGEECVKMRNSHAVFGAGFPRILAGYGCSFIAITEAPAASDKIRSLCYGKPVERVVVVTGEGELLFEVERGANGGAVPKE